MECFAQYLDNIEDLVYAFALKWERIRQYCRFLFFIVISLAMQAAGVMLALSSPPVAMAVASLLLVAMLYRAVVSYQPSRPSQAFPA